MQSEVKFGLAANAASDYASFSSEWTSFVEAEVNSPFNMDFYEISLYTSLVEFDCLKVDFHQTADW